VASLDVWYARARDSLAMVACLHKHMIFFFLLRIFESFLFFSCLC
jgi:hypothetical protein